MAVETVAPPVARERRGRVDTTPMIVQRRSTIAHLHLGSVAKVAIVFWTAVGVLTAGAVVVMRALLDRYGAIENAESFVTDVTGVENFRILSTTVVAMLLILVSLFVLVATTLTIVGAAFYNALARLTGGIEMTVTEEFGRLSVPAASPAVQQAGGARSNGHAVAGSVSKS